MAVLAHFEEAVDSDRRVSRRQVLRLGAAASIAPAANTPVIIHNLSAEGLLIETAAALPIGTRFAVELAEADATDATVVWKREQRFGCEFVKPLPKAALSAAMLRNPVGVSPNAYPLGVDSRPRELPFGLRLWIIIGLSLAAWAAILALIWL